MQFHIVLNSQAHLTLPCSRWVVLKAFPWPIIDTQGLSFRYILCRSGAIQLVSLEVDLSMPIV
jgi:hypothetical protein